MKLNIFLVLFVPFVLHLTVSEKILFLTPMGSPSHKIFYMGFVEVIAARGHQVTMVSGHKPSKNITNVREVVINDFSLDKHFSSIFDESNTKALRQMFANAPIMCSDTLGQEHIQDLKKEHFDLIIMSMFLNSCYLSFVHHFKVPFIYASPGGMFGIMSDMMNNIEFLSLTPNKKSTSSFPLSFKERLENVALHYMFAAANTYYLEPNFMGICIERGLCPPDMPSTEEISSNVSLAIINSVHALEWPPRPAMPNVIYAGGAHIKPAKPLPKELEEWIDGSGSDGFIFFSLGSALKPTHLPERYRTILIKVFGSLKQRVLWKWNEDTMADLPENVKLSKWLPQADILGHPKLRLFITHGGLLSTQESMFNGVRIIGMPIFADQHSNMAQVQIEGWGSIMDWTELEETTFRNLIVDTINNEKMKEISMRKSVLMKDRLMPPADYAAYWVEYVLRHKGAPHIMSPVRLMKWYEVYNMDVYALLIGAGLVVLYIFWRLLKFACQFCIGSSKSSPKKKAD